MLSRNGVGIRAHTQLVRERSSAVVSFRWASVDWSWPKEWNWCARESAFGEWLVVTFPHNSRPRGNSQPNPFLACQLWTFDLSLTLDRAHRVSVVSCCFLFWFQTQHCDWQHAGYAGEVRQSSGRAGSRANIGAGRREEEDGETPLPHVAPVSVSLLYNLSVFHLLLWFFVVCFVFVSLIFERRDRSKEKIMLHSWLALRERMKQLTFIGSVESD